MVHTLDLKPCSSKTDDAEYSQVDPSQLPLKAVPYHYYYSEDKYRDIDTELRNRDAFGCRNHVALSYKKNNVRNSKIKVEV